MALDKVTYVDRVTTIPAQNLNDIQDAIIANEDDISNLSDEMATAAADISTLQGDVLEAKGDITDLENGKQDALTFDATPTSGSDNSVKSGGIYDAIKTVKDDADDALALKAPLVSPALTGTPTAPTPAQGDDSTKIATTGFVQGELEPYAEQDGNYPDMTAGNASQLLSTTGTTDNAPYLFRRSGGGGSVGNREIDKIIGGSVAWNQLVQTTDTSVTVTSGHKYLSRINSVETIGVSDGTPITITDGTADNVHDLTLMFGTTIADYIYSLEQATPGAGIAWIKSYGFFDKPYYAYDPGSIQNVSVSAHIMRGADNNIIGNYPLDSTELRGIPKLDANNNLYYDGDIYPADGQGTRRYGIVDLGALVWNKGTYISSASISAVIAKPATNNIVANAICSAYPIVARNAATLADKQMSIQADGAIFVNDTSYSTVSEFAAAMSGVYLIYELATPTALSLTPYQSPQIVSPDGTEKYVDAGVETGTRDVGVPVGHETFYPADLVGAIERVMEQVPDAPSSDGTYTLQVTVSGGVATYSWVSN